MTTSRTSVCVPIVLALLLTACAGRGAAPDQLDVLKKLYASTLQILVKQPDGTRRTGSGVVLHVDRKTGEAFVVTAAHVLTDRSDIEVHVVGKFRRNTHSARVLLYDGKEDIALLSATGVDVSPVSVGGQSELGQDIWVISYPWGRRRTLVTGVVSQIDWPKDPGPGAAVPLEGAVRLIDATVGYGTSGGGVFEIEHGGLVGLVRGYRSVKIPLPGQDGKTVSLPIAGETTVIPVHKIADVLAAQGFGHLLPRAVSKKPY